MWVFIQFIIRIISRNEGGFVLLPVMGRTGTDD